jgi:hypothetical protein
MPSRSTLAAIALMLPACGTPREPPATPPAPALDPATLAEPSRAAQAFLRTRASSDPDQEIFFHWTGTIHELRPDADQAARNPLLRFEGFNVARIVPLEGGGQRLLSREITVYQDAEGQIIDCWSDPAAGSDAAGQVVLHTRNDPVSFDLGTPGHRVLDDRVVWSLAIPLAYPSPLPVVEHPLASAGDTYRSVELFDFEVGLADLADTSLSSVPARVVWSRVGQWLPWMSRGQQPGWLVYHATGRKLPGGWDDLPNLLRAWVVANAPAHQHAPSEDLGPNQTTWSVYRDAAASGALSEGCIPGA